MIVVNNLMQNGIGNRLFMIAAAFSHAEKMKTEAWLCDFEYQDYLRGPFHCCVNDDINQCIYKGDYHSTYRENSYLYQKLPEKKNLILNGYFQNEKYFSENKEKILQLFYPNDNFISLLKDDDIYRQILLYKNSISLHIRRGDYIKLDGVFIQLGSDYYSRALIHIRNRIALHEPCLVVIFTDGKRDEISFIFEVCRKLGFSTVVVSESRKDILDLMLMACCRHHIIANSTFSWWGAYLSENFIDLHLYSDNYKKIIVCPKVFFTQQFCDDYQNRISAQNCTPYLSSWQRV